MKGRKWILTKNFQGFPKDTDLELVEEELPTLGDGDVYTEALYWSVDPYMRPFSNTLPAGSAMPGAQVSKVLESKNPKYPVGTLLLTGVGWRDKTVFNPDQKHFIGFLNTLPALDTGSHPSSLNLGVLGMPGISAFIGLIKLCEPKSGETVYVNSAAGIVGSVVGQLAKIKGCRVIGSAGTDEKCKWLKDELGFDYVFNYKTQDLKEALKEGAPNGIDCFFDNVGDSFSTDIILNFMNRYGRICCCGAISQYHGDEPPKNYLLYGAFVFKELKMQGFICSSFFDEFPSIAAELKQWIDEGKLKYREDVVTGLENMREAFYGMLRGNYFGKVVIKA